MDAFFCFHIGSSKLNSVDKLLSFLAVGISGQHKILVLIHSVQPLVSTTFTLLLFDGFAGFLDDPRRIFLHGD